MRLWRLGRLVYRCRRGDGEELSGTVEMILASAAGEQAVVADAVKALGKNMEQEPADELVGAERHHLLAIGAAAAIVLIAERNAVIAEAD